MPEGDTIRRLADKITRRFAGERCSRCITRDPRLVGLDLAGRTLVDADAVGKHLLVRFDDGRTLHAHLRMDGSFEVGPASKEPEWRRRVELWMDTGRLTAIDVPVLEIVSTQHEDSVVGHLGPDLCAPTSPDLTEALERLTSDAERPLAGALLDQRNVAGFGNVYAVEIPFLFGVSPNQPVGAVTGLDALLAVGAALIRTNAERGPQNTTGRRLANSEHWIYGRRRRPCPLCAAPLDGWDEADSPWGRVATWCPVCQRLQPQRAADLRRATRLLALHPARRNPLFPGSAARGGASAVAPRPDVVRPDVARPGVDRPDVRGVPAPGRTGRMTDAGDPRPGATDDSTAQVVSNGERMPTGDAAVAENVERAEDLEQRRTGEHRGAGEPTGTSITDPTP